MLRKFFLLGFFLFLFGFARGLSASETPSFPECRGAPHERLCMAMKTIQQYAYVTYTADDLEKREFSALGLRLGEAPRSFACRGRPYEKLCNAVVQKHSREERFLRAPKQFVDHYYYWPPAGSRRADGENLLILPWGGKAETVDVYQDIASAEVFESAFGIARSVTFTSSRKDGICSFRWNEFDRRIIARFHRAVDECFSRGKPKGIIIDLIGNPGGNLETTLVIASSFLPQNAIIVYEKNKDTDKPAPIQGWFPSNPRLADIPLVFLVNRNSASASEMLSGSLQKHKRAVILGTDPRTYGKHTGQLIFEFDRGAWAMAFTVTEWFLPDMTTDEGGLIPDKIVSPARAYEEARAMIKNFPYTLPLTEKK